jgi:hypothetical protein
MEERDGRGRLERGRGGEKKGEMMVGPAHGVSCLCSWRLSEC